MMKMALLSFAVKLLKFKMQTRKQSFIEAATNVIIGYVVAVMSQIIVFPMFGVKSTISQNIKIGLIFTVISLARSYLLRRYFNNKQ